jgi:hypothetical protein
MRLQNGGDYDLVGLRAARDEVDAGVRRSDRLFNEFGGAGAVSVHPVTHGLFKVGFNERFDNLGMCAFGVVALEVDHIFILGKPEILLLFYFSPQQRPKHSKNLRMRNTGHSRRSFQTDTEISASSVCVHAANCVKLRFQRAGEKQLFPDTNELKNKKGSVMRLAEALRERSDLQIRIGQLRERLNANAKVQHGLTPSENPAELLAELSRAVAKMAELIERINRTNANCTIGDETIGALIAMRNWQMKELDILRDFVARASSLVDRYSKSEILIEPTVDVAALQKEIDEKAKAVRLLDNKIQEANWTTDLL